MFCFLLVDDDVGDALDVPVARGVLVEVDRWVYDFSALLLADDDALDVPVALAVRVEVRR